MFKSGKKGISVRTGQFSDIRSDTGPNLMSGASLAIVINIYRRLIEKIMIFEQINLNDGKDTLML